MTAVTDVSADLSRPEPGHEGGDELPPEVTAEDGPALEELATAGWGEGDHEDAGLPPGHWERQRDSDRREDRFR